MPQSIAYLAALLALLVYPAGQSLADAPQGGEPPVGEVRGVLPIDLSRRPADSEQQVRAHAARIEKKLIGFFDEHHAAEALPTQTVELVHRVLGDASKWVAYTQYTGRPRPEGWFDRKAWIPATRALRDAGFSDPLFWGVADAMQRDDTGDRLRRAMSNARQMRKEGYPSEAALLVGDLGLLVNWVKKESWTRSPSLNQFRDETYRALAAWCRAPGPIEPAFERWWADLAVRLSKNASVEQVQAAYAAFAQGASDQDDKAWLRHLALGALAVEAAWEHRGGGWSHTVTDEGWAGFRRSLGRAASDLDLAHQARPHLPQAATLMIKVAMGQNSGDETRWFNAAVRADPSDQAPWSRLAEALRPRWGGSYAAVLDMGLRAAAEGPVGSQIPAVLTKAIDDILTDDGEDWLVEHQHRWLPALTRQLERSEAATPSLQAVGTLAYAVAFRSGDFDRAQRLYRMLEPDPAREGLGRGLGRTNDFGVDQRWDAGLAAIRSNPEAAAALDRATHAAGAGAQPQEAVETLRAAAGVADDPLVRRALSDLALAHERQAAYDRGEPVELLSHGVAGWRVSRGHVEPAPGAGVRAHYNENSGSRLISTLNVGEHYELALDLAPPALWGGRELFVVAGIQLGVDEKVNTLNQTAVYFEREGLLETRSPGEGRHNRWATANQLTHNQTIGRHAARIFVRRFGKTADLYHNGVPVQRGWEVREPVRGGPLALGLYWPRRGKVGVDDPIHYRSLWVRRLTNAEGRKRAEDDPSSIFHQHSAYEPVVDAPGKEPRWTPPAAPTAELPGDPTPVADPPFAQQEVAALYADVWKHSFNQTAHAQAGWAPAARALIDREAIRMAGSVDAFRLRPEGYVHRNQERPEAQRLLDAGAREDLLIRALCRAVVIPNPINRSAVYNEPSSNELTAAGHTELADLLRRKRAWLHEPDYRPWAWVERSERALMWPDRVRAAEALSRRADWLAKHPQHAAPLARLIQPRPLEQQERHANHWRRVSGPAVQAGGAAEWIARSLRLAYDTAAARTIIDGWYRSDPAHRHDNTLRLALDLLARGEAEAVAAWPLASEPAMQAQLAGAIAEAAMDSARAVTGLGRPQDAHRLAQNASDWFHAAAAATPLDTRVFDQWRGTLNRLQEAGGVLAGEPLPPHHDLEAWSTTYRHTWEAHLSLNQMPAAQRLGAAQASLAWWHFWPSTPDDDVLREHLTAASREWLREHGDTALDATLGYARRVRRHPYFGEAPESCYGHAVSLARWLGQPERASQILAEAGGPEAVGDLGGFGLTPVPAPEVLQAAYDAGETIDLMDPAADVWQPLLGRFERTEHQGRRVFTVPAGYAHGHWLYCPLDIGDQYRVTYTVVDPGGWYHSSRATSSVGIAFNAGADPVLPNFRSLPYLGLANNRSVAVNSIFDNTPGGYSWGTGHALQQLEKANLQGPNYRVVIENRQGTLSLSVNDIVAWENQTLPGGEPGGGFAIGFTPHYLITVPAVRITEVKVEKLLPAAGPGQTPGVSDSAGKRPPRAPR